MTFFFTKMHGVVSDMIGGDGGLDYAMVTMIA